jgi:hypothetical protein
MPGHTSNLDELVGIAQSVEFTGLSADSSLMSRRQPRHVR